MYSKANKGFSSNVTTISLSYNVTYVTHLNTLSYVWKHVTPVKQRGRQTDRQNRQTHAL